MFGGECWWRVVWRNGCCCMVFCIGFVSVEDVFGGVCFMMGKCVL